MPASSPAIRIRSRAARTRFADLLQKWGHDGRPISRTAEPRRAGARSTTGFTAGTTSIQAADEEGWVVSVTPSGGWIPAVIAGRTGIGMSQRMQSFVLDRAEGPFNVLEPGKRPRVTLTPTLALKDGRPYLSFAVQGGDGQDQNLLQFFLNVVEFGMTVQQAVEAANINSYQMRSSFDDHGSRARPHHAQRGDAGVGARRAAADGLPARLPAAHVGTDQRDLLRLEERLDVGRVEQSRGGLRDRVVARSRLRRARGSRLAARKSIAHPPHPSR